MGTRKPHASIRIAPWLLAAVGLSACSTVDVSTLPTDASAHLAILLANAQSAARASQALQWGEKIERSKLAKKPAEIAPFADAQCANQFGSSVLAAKSLGAFNEEIIRLAKAPDASFAGYIDSINSHQRAIEAAQRQGKSSPDKVPEALKKLHDKCTEGVSRDLGLTVPGAPAAPQSVLAALAAFQALMAIPQKVLQIVESKKRAEAVRAYVKASEEGVYLALDTLGKDGGLDQAIQQTRTYLVRRTYVLYSDVQDEVLSTGHSSSAATRAADEYAALVPQYLKLQDLSGKKIIEDPDEGLRAAYKTFAEAAKNPNADPLRALDGFLAALQNIADLDKAIGEFTKARKDISGS